MKSFKEVTEATVKIKWVKTPDGYIRGNHGVTKPVFKWVSSDGRFEIGRSGSEEAGRRGLGKGNRAIVWKISDSQDPLRKWYRREYKTAAAAKREMQNKV
jgi:hypothetical protein